MTDDEWFDEAAGRLGRLYALTGGRTSPTNRQLDLATQIRTAQSSPNRSALEPEHVQIVDLCHRWLSVAEIAAYLRVPLVVAKVQLSDLIDRGVVMMAASSVSSGPSDRATLQAVLEHLKEM